MNVFRYFERDGGKGSDRSARDRQRHNEKVRNAIRDNIGNIISEEAIIGKSGNRKIKIPIRGIKEYRFVFGDNSRGVAQGDGKQKSGDIIKKGFFKKGPGMGKAGDKPGEDIYETEITLDTVIEYLFEDLNLPEMEKKKLRTIEFERLIKKKGYKRKGIRTAISRKKTAIERVKRKKASQVEPDERFPFHEQDLRYNKMVKDTRYYSNAVVFCIMDTSGSMDVTKKYLARSFYFLLYKFIMTRYQNVEIVFIAHHTEAKEVTEEEFFHKGESGGTMISSGYEKAYNIIEERYHPALWNIYAFHCSDGDNFPSDNEAAIQYASKLKEICNLFGYGEIKPEESYSWGSMLTTFKKLEGDNFVLIAIRKKEEVWPALKKFLSKERVKKEEELPV